MNKYTKVVMEARIIIFAFSFMIIGCQTKKNSATNINDGGLELPQGFTATVVAEDLGRGRHIDVNTNGDIYLSLRRKNNGGGIVCLRDTSGDFKADIIEYFGDVEGTGISIHNGYLYFGTDQKIVRFPLQEGNLLPEDEMEELITGFSDQNQHETKPFTFDNNGHIYVTVGAPSNACMEQTRTVGSPGMDPCPQLEWHAGIWRFDANRLGQTQKDDGMRYATGIRNGLALDWNHAENMLYCLQHGRDQLHQFYPDLYTEEMNAELPAEEFLRVTEGSDFGWPYCYYDHLKNKRVMAPEYGGDGEMVGRCADKADPIMAFPGHIAPNDLVFYTGDMFPERYKNGAFIAFHGSWNRGPLEQKGYYVVFVPMEGGLPSGEWEIFADGFIGQEVIESPREAEYRPCGLAVSPDGALYINDSNKGKIWRIAYSRN